MRSQPTRRPLLTREDLATPLDGDRNRKRRRHRRRVAEVGGGALALLVAAAGALALIGNNGDGHGLVAGTAEPPPSGVEILGASGTARPLAPTSTATPATTTAAPTAAGTPATTTAATAATAAMAATPTTESAVTTVAACRNSANPSCGPFFFEPQPGPDRPMTVEVVVTTASPRVGQEVVFRVTRHDADGVSFNAFTVGYGEPGSTTGTSSLVDCQKFGAWEPPAKDPAHATEVQEYRHAYQQPGTFTATFSFQAGPFACVDSRTGRGDRAYASSGKGTVTLVVRP